MDPVPDPTTHDDGDAPRVVVVGAGYAGIHAARTARDAGVAVTVVDPSGHHDLAPRLAAVAAGRRPEGDAWIPVEDLLDVDVVRERAVEVLREPDEVVRGRGEGAGPGRAEDERGRPAVVVESGREVAGDAVVVTAGARAWLPPVDGLDPAAAVTLTDAADALRIRSALATTDALVVVGAGGTGVQLAAEVAARHRLRVHLVEVSPRLLDAFPRALGRRAAKVLRARDVDVRLDTDVTRADRRGVELGDGHRIDGLVVWTTGVAADASAVLPWAPVEDGRVLVDRCLRVDARVLAAGDVAATTDVFGRTTAQSAQIALSAGRAAGRNAAAIARGRAPSPAMLVDLGWIVDLGGTGVAQVGPLGIALPPLDRIVPLLHEAVDARHLLQAGGLGALLRHAPSRHRPSPSALRRAERPTIRSVG